MLTRLLVTAVAGLCITPIYAKNIELAIMPGSVIEGHVKLEAQCEKCHIRFDRDAQPKLCRDCHKPVDADILDKQGYHGRLAHDNCRECHTDHKGRDARIVILDEISFDHSQTDYPLRATHEKTPCKDCHPPHIKQRDTPSECLSCHQKKDKHEGAFGIRCESCHKETTWDQLTFNHDVDTRFRLLGRHRMVSCTDCHSGTLYQQKTPTLCRDCHSKADVHKNGLGDRCETCHSESSWKDTRFEHNRDTKFMLRDKHTSTQCEACHKPDTLATNLPDSCHGCHADDDRKNGHKGRYGKKCESCHNEKGFKPGIFRHDRDTHYPLRHRHKDVKCDSCHTGAGIHEKLGTKCVNCHERDDMEKGHKGRYGEKCESCHNEKGFKPSIFRHDRDTHYLLRYRHKDVKCDVCHDGPGIHEKLGTQCINCHERDDLERGHRGRYGEKCETCHVENTFRTIIFEHDHDTSYPLSGKHRQTKCDACHLEPLGLVKIDTRCHACHEDDDVHLGTFDQRCDQCHVTEDWRKILKQEGAR